MVCCIVLSANWQVRSCIWQHVLVLRSSPWEITPVQYLSCLSAEQCRASEARKTSRNLMTVYTGTGALSRVTKCYLTFTEPEALFLICPYPDPHKYSLHFRCLYFCKVNLNIILPNTPYHPRDSLPSYFPIKILHSLLISRPPVF